MLGRSLALPTTPSDATTSTETSCQTPYTLLSKRSESRHREKIPSASGMRQLPGTLRFLAASESGESQTSGLTPTARLGCGRGPRQVFNRTGGDVYLPQELVPMSRFL